MSFSPSPPTAASARRTGRVGRVGRVGAAGGASKARQGGLPPQLLVFLLGQSTSFSPAADTAEASPCKPGCPDGSPPGGVLAEETTNRRIVAAPCLELTPPRLAELLLLDSKSVNVKTLLEPILSAFQPRDWSRRLSAIGDASPPRPLKGSMSTRKLDAI
eukprot:CAMPEP_0119539246 /NCGR_PEP_ID=MMETSP1344-20130328/51460_1 /TAXON_ID=236787 /ORGANISM="Florenciella parvula, Strain CCMP2471" /LENGTH=159 /DNA_ID=CAMNT_0007582477 /DNA_START=287 /DNA_END=766 /DNA_ORIENTATION=-